MHLNAAAALCDVQPPSLGQLMVMVQESDALFLTWLLDLQEQNATSEGYVSSLSKVAAQLIKVITPSRMLNEAQRDRQAYSKAKHLGDTMSHTGVRQCHALLAPA